MTYIGSSALLGTPPPGGDGQPTTAEQAAEKIADLKRDAEFTRKLLAGDSETKKKWSDLHELAARPTSITTGDLPAHSERTIDAVAEYADVPPAVQDQLRSGQPVSATEYKAAVQRRAQLMADQDWSARYLAGGQRERRELMLVNTILTSRVTLQK